MFLHADQKDKDNMKDSKQKCDACKFENFEDKVKLFEIKEQNFMLCPNCDKNLEHKEILVTKKIDMKDYLSVKFRNASLSEIAKMVNY